MWVVVLPANIRGEDSMKGLSAKDMTAISKREMRTELKLEMAQQDIRDLLDSRQTSFVRCSKCHRYHDAGYLCPHC